MLQKGYILIIERTTKEKFGRKYQGLKIRQDKIKKQIKSWIIKDRNLRRDYNEFRPHSVLDNMTPEEYAKKHVKISNLRSTAFGLSALYFDAM